MRRSFVRRYIFEEFLKLFVLLIVLRVYLIDYLYFFVVIKKQGNVELSKESPFASWKSFCKTRAKKYDWCPLHIKNFLTCEINKMAKVGLGKAIVNYKYVIGRQKLNSM